MKDVIWYQERANVFSNDTGTVRREVQESQGYRFERGRELKDHDIFHNVKFDFLFAIEINPQIGRFACKDEMELRVNVVLFVCRVSVVDGLKQKDCIIVS